MHTIFALIVLSLLMLGLVSVVDMMAKTIRARRNPSTEPLNYEGWADAASTGLSGADVDTTHAVSGLGRIGAAIVHFLGHFFHH